MLIERHVLSKFKQTGTFFTFNKFLTKQQKMLLYPNKIITKNAFSKALKLTYTFKITSNFKSYQISNHIKFPIKQNKAKTMCIISF